MDFAVLISSVGMGPGSDTPCPIYSCIGRSKHLSGVIKVAKHGAFLIWRNIINVKDFHCFQQVTAVHQSVVKGYETVVQFLLKQRTNISAKDRYGTGRL
jgi:hypothetical protein